MIGKVDGEDEHHHHHHHLKQQIAELTHAVRKVGLMQRRFEPGGNRAESGATPRHGDHHPRRAASDRGAEEDGIAAPGDRRIAGYCPGFLLDWEQLAGERRLGNEKIARAENAAVGRHKIARAQLDDVAGHQLDNGTGGERAVAQDLDREREPLAQRLHRARGVVLLQEAKRATAQHNQQDNRRIEQLM